MAVPDSQIRYFIELLGGLAVAECNKRIAEGKGFVLPSVCIAQSAHETGWGTAGIMVKANAFFGIKAGGSWTGKIYVADTWEVAENGERYNTVANFRAYDSLEDSVADYYNLIVNNTRYAKGICYGADKSQWLTSREALTAIWAGGYATDDEYVPHVMNLLNGRNLSEVDKLITGEPPIDYSFTKADFTQGVYTAGDSGRSLTLDATSMLGISLKVDKQITLEREKTLRINHPNASDLVFKTIYVVDDVYKEYSSSQLDTSLKLPAGAIIAFTIQRTLDTGEVTQLPYDAMADFEVRIYEARPNTGAGEEQLITGIAKFVKIE